MTNWFRRGRHRGTYRPRRQPLLDGAYLMHLPRRGCFWPFSVGLGLLSKTLIVTPAEVALLPFLATMHRATESSPSVYEVIANAKRYSIEDFFKMRDRLWSARGHASVAELV